LSAIALHVIGFGAGGYPVDRPARFDRLVGLLAGLAESDQPAEISTRIGIT
jgi:hypothetical protein